MTDFDTPIGMPRVLLAIRLGLFVFFALGIILVVLTDSATRPWLYGTGVMLAILFGVLSLLFHALRFVSGSHIEEIPATDGQWAGSGRSAPAQSDGGGGRCGGE